MTPGAAETGPGSVPPMSRPHFRRAMAAFVLVALAFLALGADWRTPPPGEGPETIPVQRIDGEGYVAVNDLARILDATKFWRADVRKLVLRVGPHTMVFTVGNPFVLVDDATYWLGVPVRSKGGEVHVPVALVDSLPVDSTLARLIYDGRRNRVVVLPASGIVGSPRFTLTEEVTRLVFPAERADEAVVVTRARAHFRVRFSGVFIGALPDSMPAPSLVRAIRPIASAGGSAFELAVDPGARGYRLLQDVDARRVTLELSRSGGEGYEEFAPQDPKGERRLHVIVIDPGHGGGDAGVVSSEVAEKDLTLTLARLLEAELEGQGVRVVLTRSDDLDLAPEARAEIANRVGADLMISLHFDGYVDPRARGATAYSPPASVAEGRSRLEAGTASGAPAAASRVTLLPWRDVSTRHAVQSRALAEAVLSSLELRGLGPTRLREHLPCELLGVNAPGILLECATLTASQDRERVTQEAGLKQLAATMAQGVAAYRRNE